MDFPVLQTIPPSAKIVLWEHNPAACRPLALEISYMVMSGYRVYRMTPFGLVRVDGPNPPLGRPTTMCFG